MKLFIHFVVPAVIIPIASADECSLYAAVAGQLSPFSHSCDDNGMCTDFVSTEPISCIDAYNALEFVRPLSPSTDGLYRIPQETHSVPISLVQENTVADFLSAPTRVKNLDELVLEWSQMSDNTTGPSTAILYMEYTRTLISLTDLLASGNSKRPLYMPEIHRPLLQTLKSSVERLDAIVDDEQIKEEFDEFVQAVESEIRGSKFLRNYLWMVDKLLMDCMHSLNPTGCTRALVPFVYSVTHLFHEFEIANKVSMMMLGEMKYNFLMSAVQLDPEINGTAPESESPWKLAMMSNIFKLEHFLEKPILGIPTDGFTVLEQSGFTSEEDWLDSLIKTFITGNMHIAAEAEASAKLMEKFTNFFYHVETEILRFESTEPIPEFITAKLCGSVEIVNWFINNIPSLSGFSVTRGVVGFFRLCPPHASMPLRPRVKYMLSNFNAARNRGLVGDKVKLHINPGNVVQATLAVFKYIPSYDLRDYDAIDIVMEEVVVEQSTGSPTAGLWGVLEAMVVSAEEGDTHDSSSTPQRLRSASRSSSEEVPVPQTPPVEEQSNDENDNGDGNESDGWETTSTVPYDADNVTVAANETESVSAVKLRWIELALSEFLECGNELTVQHADDESLEVYPDLGSRSNPQELRSIGRLLALGLLGGDPGDSISYIVESRMRIGKRAFRDILFFGSESVETGFYDVFNYPLFDLMLAPDEFFAFLTILREPDIRDRALGAGSRTQSRVAQSSVSGGGHVADDEEESAEEETEAMHILRDLHVLPHEDSDREFDIDGDDEYDDEEGGEDDEDDDDGEDVIIQLFGDWPSDEDGDEGAEGEDDGYDEERGEEEEEADDDHLWEDMDSNDEEDEGEETSND